MKINWSDEKETLEELINNNIPYVQIGKQYGVSDTTIKKAAKKLGIKLPIKRKINPKEHFNKGVKKIHKCLNCGKEFYHSNCTKNKFCSNKCNGEYKRKEKIKLWKDNPNDFNDSWSYPFIRNFLLEKYNFKCQKCGWGEKNEYTNKTPLEIHHIDGDCTNNSEDNLQLLCPNCHSLTENFGRNNKNSKRYKLREYKLNLKNKQLLSSFDKLDDLKKQEIFNKLKIK